VKTFFDPALFEAHGAGFIREDHVDAALRKLIPNACITKGQYSYASRSQLRDLAWNHMDQNHRPFIHNTYGDAIRIHIGTHAAFSLTRFGKLPVVLPVFDGHFRENGFYQVVCLFGLIVVVNVIECNGTGEDTRMDIAWAIASHHLLRFLHKPLNRRLLRLNDIQNKEDDRIRDRRIALRAAGYRFRTDQPDFVTSNVVAHNVIFPDLLSTHRLAVADLPEGVAKAVELGDRSYVLRRTGQSVEVWPGICPHEGAPLGPAELAQRTIKCPWHGLEFASRTLVPGGGAITVCGAQLTLEAGELTVRSVRQTAVSA
jgi:nitrite reductase/ring-hydroxylating ferredoxin subunit